MLSRVPVYILAWAPALPQVYRFSVLLSLGGNASGTMNQEGIDGPVSPVALPFIPPSGGRGGEGVCVAQQDPAGGSARGP